MSFEWKEYLELAQCLKDRNTKYSNEAGFRSAISRAYYAAFCHALCYVKEQYGRDLVKECEKEGKRPGDVHKKIEDFFKEKGREQKRWALDVAEDLIKLRGWRKQCDYEKEGPEEINNTVTSAITLSQSILKQLQPRRW